MKPLNIAPKERRTKLVQGKLEASLYRQFKAKAKRLGYTKDAEAIHDLVQAWVDEK